MVVHSCLESQHVGGSQRQVDVCKIEAHLIYIASSRPTQATESGEEREGG